MNFWRYCNFLMLLFLSWISFASEELFVVGTTSGYAPYVSINEKGEYEGFDIDIAKLISERLRRKLVIKDLGSMSSLLIALQKKKIDSLIWAISITEDRLKEMLMIYYHGEKVTSMPFLFWKKIPDGISTISDLGIEKNRIVCVETGSYQDSILQKYPQIKIRNLDKIIDGIMEIRYGKSFTTLVDYSLLPRLQNQFPELKVLHLPLPSDQQSLGYGICMEKSNIQLAGQVEKIISDLRSEGKILELEKKWKLLQ